MPTLSIRPYTCTDAPALHALFHASVHGLARSHYSAAQLAAWAPQDWDAVQWKERLQANQPFVALAADGVTLPGLPTCRRTAISTSFSSPPPVPGRAGRRCMAHLQTPRRQRRSYSSRLPVPAHGVSPAARWPILRAQATACNITRLWAT
ncbi:GNAT family protein [Melaminivora sp.]